MNKGTIIVFLLAMSFALLGVLLWHTYTDQMELKKYASMGRICELEHGERK